MRSASGLMILVLAPSAAPAADFVYLSDYLGVPSGEAAIGNNPPYTTIPTDALPYGFGADCPGNFASSPIVFQDFGPFAKGIGQHPFISGPKRIDFNLNAIRVHTTRDVAVFSARVGVDFPTSLQNNGGVFTVLVDGVLKQQIFIGGRFSASQELFVSVVNASTISLVTARTGDFNSNHLCWGEASLSLIGGPCPADLNGDRLVDDEDFSIFAAAYNTLDCADPSMPEDCPADLDRNAFVDDADFSLFVVPYNDLLCS
ncbi:MAG: NPCBM/NEW2 domain-containing protein [Phycisphaerales bacterium]